MPTPLPSPSLHSDSTKSTNSLPWDSHTYCRLGSRRFRQSLAAFYASIEAALEPVKLFECIGK